MIRTLSSVVALAAFSAVTCAQGVWPDDPWTDSRSIKIPGDFRNVGRAVAISGGFLYATYNDPKTDIGTIGIFKRGDRGYDFVGEVRDPSADPTEGFGYPMLGSTDRLFVADAGFYATQHAQPTSFPGGPNGPARVEVFRQLGDQSLAHVQTLDNPTGEQHSGFGFAMALDRYLVVGAPFADVFGVEDVGAVFIYERLYQQLEYFRIATLLPPTPSPRGYFGYSVAQVDDTIVVGWPGYANDEGRAVLFEDSGVNDWKLDRVIAPDDLPLPEGLRLGFFGASVAANSLLNDFIAIASTLAFSEVRGQHGVVSILSRERFNNEEYALSALIEQPQTFSGADFGRFLHIAESVPFNYLVVGSGARNYGGGIINIYRNEYFETDWTREAYLRFVNAGSVAVQFFSNAAYIFASGNSDDRALFYTREVNCFPELRGDANGDGVTNFEDLNLVLTNFGLEGDDIPGDINNNGVVDFTDLNFVIYLYASPCLPPN